MRTAGNSQAAPGLAARKRWIFRLAAICILPLVLAGGIELVLRTIGYGYPTGFFLKSKRGTESFLIENAKFAWRFIPPRMARTPQPLVLPEIKPAGVFRIFILGESAAMGDPEPAFGFPRVLRVLLENRFPGRTFEVVNTAMTAINSHAVLPIARECSRQAGDLWVIYMGNNEVVGPFGPGTVFGVQNPSLGSLQLMLTLKATKVGQWMSGLLSSSGSESSQRKWSGMEMFIEQQVAAGDSRLDTVYRHFSRNLETIIETGLAHQTKVILCTVAANLKDCAPFASQHGAAFKADQATAWDQYFRQGVDLENRGQWREALDAFQQASQLDPTYAELSYHRGKCQSALGQFDQARQDYQAALEQDTLRFRADSRINQAIRETARLKAGNELSFVDAALAFETNSPNRICGGLYFWEHVHFNFAGNYLLAKLVGDQVANILKTSSMPGATNSWMTMEQCAQELGWTDWHQYRLIEAVRSRLQRHPFISQFGAVDRDRRLSDFLTRLHPATEPDALKNHEKLFQQALAKRPGDWILQDQYAKMLEAFGQNDRAAVAWRKVLELVPHHLMAHFQLGRVLNRGTDRAEAIRYLQAALKLMPRFPEAQNSLGIAYAHQKRYDQAYRQFANALESRPDFADAHVSWGMTLANQHDFGGAIGHLEAALKLNTNHFPAHVNLAGILVQQNDFTGALGHYETAFRLQPVDAETHYRLGIKSAAEGNAAEAMVRFSEAVRLKGDLLDARHHLGVAFARQRIFNQAEIQFREIIRQKAEFLPAHFDLGVTLAQQGKLDEAKAEFQEVLRLDPNHSQAREYLAKAVDLRKNLPDRKDPGK